MTETPGFTEDAAWRELERDWFSFPKPRVPNRERSTFVDIDLYNMLVVLRDDDGLFVGVARAWQIHGGDGSTRVSFLLVDPYDQFGDAE